LEKDLPALKIAHLEIESSWISDDMIIVFSICIHIIHGFLMSFAEFGIYGLFSDLIRKRGFQRLDDFQFFKISDICMTQISFVMMSDFKFSHKLWIFDCHLLTFKCWKHQWFLLIDFLCLHLILLIWCECDVKIDRIRYLTMIDDQILISRQRSQVKFIRLESELEFSDHMKYWYNYIWWKIKVNNYYVIRINLLQLGVLA